MQIFDPANIGAFITQFQNEMTQPAFWVAVANAANGSVPLLILGLAISVPLIVAGAALIMALLEKMPILVWAGAALLGWIAGDVIATDPAIHPKLDALFAGPFGAGLDRVL